MRMVNPSDSQLDAAFAENVAGWRPDPAYLGKWIPPGEVPRKGVNYYTAKPPRFTTSADAVLPWLEKLKFWTCQYSEGHVTISDDHMDCNSKNMMSADIFPKAAVLVLLRAHGVEIEFTQ